MSQLNWKSIEPLFPSPLVTFDVTGAEELNRTVLAEALAMRAVSAGIRVSNQSGWHSEADFFSRTEPGCVAVRAHVLEAIRNATQRVQPNVDLSSVGIQCSAWININDRGAFNTPHEHPGWVWSGTYYVRVPDAEGRSGCIEFLDPRGNVEAASLNVSCFMPKRIVKPHDGMLVVFPSFLRHWVYPNEEAGERVSIAFNARFVPRPKST